MLGISMGCAVTALPILVLLMEKLDILRQPMGQRILRYASLDWERVGRQVGFLIALAVLTVPYRRLMAWLSPGDRWYVALIWLVLCSFGSDWAGLHFMVGAFLAGVVMDAHWFEQKKMDMLYSHVPLVRVLLRDYPDHVSCKVCVRIHLFLRGARFGSCTSQDSSIARIAVSVLI